MRKKVTKLINKIDIENNFDKINSQINYDKYVTDLKSTNRKTISPGLRVFMIVGSVYASILAFLAIDFASVNSYNKKVLSYQEEIVSLNNTSIYQINSKSKYDELVNKDFKLKETFLDNLLDNFISLKTNSAPGMGFDENLNNGVPEVEESNPSNDTMTNTNIQTNGLDEADISKCDGTYIYSITGVNGNMLEIYNLKGETLVSETLDFKPCEMYVHEDDLILLGFDNTNFYTFDGLKIKLTNSLGYMGYNTSRLYEDTLYLIVHDTLEENTETYEDLYYDGCGNAKFIYSIYKYDLNNHTYDSVRNLNAGYVQLYASNNHFYLATSISYYVKGENETYANITRKNLTVVSIFDFDLNAIGAVRILGTTLNQFSMDERNNYFRIVTTNTYAENERLNAISIFDLTSLERVGYLDEGIGLNRQVVKSVSFDESTCYVVTYENTDPLYEIDLSDVSAPQIVSIYKAPGYSSYLHQFEINGQKYLFGIGYTDDRWTRKISIYIDNGNETVQIGKDYTIGEYYYNEVDYLVTYINSQSFNNHKALFIYNDGSILYLGLKVSNHDYVIFNINVNEQEVISIYKEIKFEKGFAWSRCYLIDGTLYVTGLNEIHLESFI